jgi:hypothetical protein
MSENRRELKGSKSSEGQGSRPSCREPSLVEAGGQHVRGFRCGLDYAFILNTVTGVQDAERVMPRLHLDILVPAQKRKASSAGL